jgi:hypothetical protein
MGPYFDQSIDDFGDRLRNFVTTAGTNLYRGITEVLEKTVEERKAGQDSIAPLVQEVRDQSMEVATLQMELGKARATIWDGGRRTASSPPIDAEAAPDAQVPEEYIEEEDIDSIELVDDDDVSEPPDAHDESRKDLN